MTVGILIIAHDNVGQALLDTAVHMLGICPLRTEVLGVDRDCDPDRLRQQSVASAGRLDTGEGVLVLTDMYGSTPSNIACGLAWPGRVEVIAGINLSMLVRILNYPALNLAELTAKAVSGGHEGIMLCTAPQHRSCA